MPPGVTKITSNTISLDNSNHGIHLVTPVSLSNGFKVESILKTESDLAVQTIVETSKTGASVAAPPTPTVATSSQDVKPPKTSTKKLKEPSLNLSFPAKAGGLELKLLVQPEDQHRARYMTEGSRGAVKDKSQQSHPVIQVNILGTLLLEIIRYIRIRTPGTSLSGKKKKKIQIFVTLSETNVWFVKGFHSQCM